MAGINMNLNKIKKFVKKNVSLFKTFYYFYTYLSKYDPSKLDYEKAGNIKIKEYNLVYYFIPKIASSSLKAFFRKVTKNKRLRPGTNHKIDFPYYSEADDNNDYTKFAFVRNPYDRLISTYLNKIVSMKKKIFKLLKYNIIDDELSKNFTALQVIYYGNVKYLNELNFINFLRLINKIPSKIIDNHLKPQNKFIYKGNSLIIDRIGRLENFHNDLQDILPSELYDEFDTHKNKTQNKKNYSNYFRTNESKKLFKNIYKRDLDILGYSEI